MISIDMDMPSCCIDCPIYNHEFGECNLIDNSKYYYDGGEYYDPFEERHKKCPIKENKECTDTN